MENNIVAIAYVPVLHQGYFSFIKTLTERGVGILYLVSDEILESHEELDYINRKDRLRALPHEVVKNLIIHATNMQVESLTISSVFTIHDTRAKIIAPREDINEYIMETYFGGHTIAYENVFLRWNHNNLGEETEPKTEGVELGAFQKSIFAQVLTEATKSADWWRQVGAAIVKNGEVVSIAHNEHMPEEELPNILGDTRALFKKGVNIDYVTASHAEVGAIGEVAQKGMSTEGAELFVTDFPCPYCARLIAKSGIRKIYYMRGYAVLGGDDFFKDMGIEVVKVIL